MLEKIPRASYRLQFTPKFGFKQAQALLPYLQTLGISHIYASPIMRPRKGSTHGYDVCDPNAVNPELGNQEEFLELLHEVKVRDMGWLQDIVPNHMAYSHENAYLVEVLEHGTASQYADFFDITWDHQHEALRGRVLAPFLGKPYGQCVKAGELKIVFEHGGLWVGYYTNRYPLSPESYWTVLGSNLEELHEKCGEESNEYITFCGSLHTLKNVSHVFNPIERVSQCNMAKAVLRKLYDENKVIKDFVNVKIGRLSTVPDGDYVAFDSLMASQHFRLAFWKVAAEELNYRRFFTVSDLICVRVEHEHVFEATHKFILDLVSRDLISGLRIDHIDGLFDPLTYLQRLRAHAPNAYLVVEKILEKTENLPREWPIEGTTGYDFLNYLGYLFCDRKSRARFDSIYFKITGNHQDPEVLQADKQRLIIGKHMAGDIDNLARLILTISNVDLMGRDITAYALRRALVEVLTYFPVYRSYISTSSFSKDDAKYIATALKLARETKSGLDIEFDFIERFLMVQGDTIRAAEFDDAWKKAVMRFQQFTGPLMAKGFEDTLFYVYNRHLALNEVGGWPLDFGTSQKDFSSFINRRLKTFPFSMNSTATHDTKRGEDTRVRMHVLSEIPQEWEKLLFTWLKQNAVHKYSSGMSALPAKNDEYLLYQTLIGTFPLNGIIDETYILRINDYMIKAVREAKVHTAWIKPDDEYEHAVSDFVKKCLDETNNSQFVHELRHFSQKISWHGLLNSLSQLTLKLSLPGIPDFYQGTETWDFSLVDPDNRQEQDYNSRMSLLPDLKNISMDINSLTEAMQTGLIKMFVIQKILNYKEQNPILFTNGDNQLLNAKGNSKDNVLAFSRIFQKNKMLIVVPRFTTKLIKAKELPLGKSIWAETRLTLPTQWHGETVTDVFSNQSLKLGSELNIGDTLSSFPVAILAGTN